MAKILILFAHPRYENSADIQDRTLDRDAGWDFLFCEVSDLYRIL
jgi:hypothetical protein